MTARQVLRELAAMCQDHPELRDAQVVMRTADPGEWVLATGIQAVPHADDPSGWRVVLHD